MNEDDRFLPTPFTITLTRDGVTDDLDDAKFVASSPEWPGLVGVAGHVDRAVDDLVYQVLNALPLYSDVVAGLVELGFTKEHLETWDSLMTGRHRHYRVDARAACEAIRPFLEGGIPTEEACQYLAIGFRPDDAVSIHRAGNTPDEAREYVDWATREGDGGRYIMVFDVVPWLVAGVPFVRARHLADLHRVEEVLAWQPLVDDLGISDSDLCDVLCVGLPPEVVANGFPMDRIRTYARYRFSSTQAQAWRISSTQAQAWEAVLAPYPTTSTDLDAIIDAAFTPDTFEAAVTDVGGTSHELAEAARLLLALKRRPDPWDEPPF